MCSAFGEEVKSRVCIVRVVTTSPRWVYAQHTDTHGNALRHVSMGITVLFLWKYKAMYNEVSSMLQNCQ